MRRLLLIGTLGFFCLAGLPACQSRTTEPVMTTQRLQDLKRLPPRPKEVKP
jgi:hypothetical protein